MPTLRSILASLGSSVQLLSQDAGDGVEIQEVLLLGPGDELPPSPGALLVCTDTTDIIARATTMNAAAVVIKRGEGEGDVDGDAVGAWSNAPLPVVAAEPSLPWHHLIQLLATAVSSGDNASGGGRALGDLFALANAIAALVGGAVAIEDPQRRVLAYSSLPDQPIDEIRQQGILGRQVPELTANDTLYRELQRATGVIKVPAGQHKLPRLAVAVRSGPEVLGSIWVVEHKPLGAEAMVALHDAARLAALHLLRARMGSDVERRARGELLRALLDGRSSPDLIALRLGLDTTSQVAVLGFRLPETNAANELDMDAVADLVQLQCGAVRPRSCVVSQLGMVYALVPLDADMPRSRLVQLANAIIERVRAGLRIELTGAIGATVATLRDITRSRDDVDAVVRLAAPGTVVTVEQALPQVVLLNLHSYLTTAPHLRLPAVDQLLAHDATHDTPYAESVLAYLAANADIPSAAASVNVHPNTFRYRLRRVKELFDLDLDDPDVRLVAWLQLKVK